MSDYRLVQFRFSHYNEKARWALDYKQVPHHRETLLAGFHVPRLKALRSRTVPVLLIDGEPLVESSAIIDYLETHHPSPALYPSDPEQRAKALEWQTILDDGLGIPGRMMFFYHCLQRMDYLAKAFAGHRPWLFQVGYAGAMGFNKRTIVRKMDLHAHVYAANQKKIDTILARLDSALEGRDYLVGDQFTVADLTAASLLSPLLLPDEFPHKPKGEPPEAVTQLIAEKRARFRTIDWVFDIYRKHRPPAACPSCEI